jgi:hypothetical protein
LPTSYGTRLLDINVKNNTLQILLDHQIVILIYFQQNKELFINDLALQHWCQTFSDGWGSGNIFQELAGQHIKGKREKLGRRYEPIPRICLII